MFDAQSPRRQEVESDKTSEPEQMMTVKQLSAYLNVSTNTVQHWRKVGLGPRGTRLGKVLRYRKDIVDAWVESCTDQTPGDSTGTPRPDGGR